MSQINPYQSPSVDASTPQEVRRPWFRWRLIPTLLLALYGGALAISSVLGLLMLPVLLVSEKASLPALQIVGVFLLCLWAGAIGLLLCYSAAWWWKGRWRRAIVGTVAGGVLYACISLVMYLLTG